VDPVHNRIRVRERRDDRVAERQIDGSMVLPAEVMRPRPPGGEAPRAGPA
jgi:hypothetical protein